MAVPIVSSVQEYFATLGERFVADASAGVQCVFQYELSGETGGTWHVVVDDGSFEVIEGAHESPTTTLKMKDADYVKMVNGALAGPMAFMTGKLRVKGSIPIARKMESIFPPNK